MSNEIDLQVSHSLELLQTLRQTVSRYAKREEQLSRDLNTRRYNTNLKSQHGLDRTEASYAAQIAGIEEVFQTESRRFRAIYEGRRDRVQRSGKMNLRDLPRHAQEAKGRWMGDLQMKNFLAERKLTADLAAADQAFGGFNSKLESGEATLTRLERRAKRAFGGFWTFRRMLRRRQKPALAETGRSGDQFEELEASLSTAEEKLGEFLRFPLTRVFRYIPLPIVFVMVLLGGAGWGFFHEGGQAYLWPGVVSALLMGVIWVFHFIAWNQTRQSATDVAMNLGIARGIIAISAASVPDMTAQLESERQKIKAEFENSAAEIQRQWGRAGDIESEFLMAGRKKIEAQVPRILEKLNKVLESKLTHIEAERSGRLAQLNGDAGTLKRQFTETHQVETGALAAEEKLRWDEIEADWKREITPLYHAVETMNSAASERFPPWNRELVDGWAPPSAFTPFTLFGHIDVDLTKSPSGIPRDPRLALPGTARLSLPLALTFPQQGSLLFESPGSGGPDGIGAFNNLILRLLATTPPGKLAFTIIDPVGLGQSFAGLMHLSDYEESLINRRIWTQRDQIEERLAELGEHIEKVIQMYLRNEYATITEYNEKAGTVAEKYYFLVVADFPAGFSETAARRLQSIAVSGPRCGVFTLVHWDQRQTLPDGFVPDELRKNSICIRRSGDEFILDKQQMGAGARLVFDPPPAAEMAVELVHKIGKSSIDSNRVEVPFSQVAPAPDQFWTNDTTQELRIAVGRTGATKLQYLAIGKGTRQHALFAGKTGSGKSTLFHVIITNLALACSPEQVEFYLIDFKKGVEFKCYATRQLPHAKVVAIESDREFALSVLQRVDGELKRRGDMFRQLGVQDIAGYKRAGGSEPMPRSLLLIDEFQEFFVEDDAIAQTASLLFDRIVRQGRAFGIHVLLGSQTLGGAYSLARATLGQMVIRVALQCNEADAYLIMDENNPAPRLLSRPGEGIYNDAAGAVEGNSPFQVVWLPDDERDLWLDKVRSLGELRSRRYPGPIVFEGNAPAEIRENHLLRSALDSSPAASPVVGRCWLGAPNSIKGPTEAVFQRQSGNHLLVVGQRDEAAVSMLGLSMLALAAQYPKAGAKFVLFQNLGVGSAEAHFMDQIVSAIPQEVVVVRGQEISTAIENLSAELKARSAGESRMGQDPAIFLCIHGLQRFKKLRHEDDFSFSMSNADAGPDPGAQFNEIISEGSSHGIHIITIVDTLNSVNRFMNRKALSEFEMRVVFQMSANDSASLIDSPKASTLGLHRALFFNEHEGYLETFRPYATPDPDWLREATEKLARVHDAAEDVVPVK